MKKRGTGIVVGIAVIVLAIGVYFIATYNSLVSAENNVDAKWSQVENVMQRRADLIPNLVNSVKGSMQHEETIVKEITDARKAYNNANTPAEKNAANEQINQGLGTMVNVIQEDYPTLASNENVKTLMVQLEGTENRISVERKNYIEQVNEYNQSLVRFPKNLAAKVLGFEKKANFEADDTAKEVPAVSFE
ncbi:LemA family protein [Enterococcus xiangfangensis]|uniref:LemA family protein n=1 Tax=Enterococcus xiangfangensis TaxID=1296537 RepID=UPI0010F6E5FB|nr:LemA family protein [Enterococcus xiangfangensis]MBM7712222.1 LemA protein [Enterococcus xiangfangensis]NBK09633.1 LemA family protein [Enterococcus asini]